MNLGGEIVFKGAGCFRDICRQDGSSLITLCFYGPDELQLTFDPASFKAVVNTVARFLLTKERAENPDEKGTARIKPDLYFLLDNCKIHSESRWNDTEGPDLVFSNSDGKIVLSFNEPQAEEIEGVCRKIKESEQLRKEVNQKKTIETPA